MTDITDNSSPPASEISRLTDHLFRHEAGKLISVLTGIFGINRLQFAEDVVQESLVRAREADVDARFAGLTARIALARSVGVARTLH